MEINNPNYTHSLAAHSFWTENGVGGLFACARPQFKRHTYTKRGLYFQTPFLGDNKKYLKNLSKEKYIFPPLFTDASLKEKRVYDVAEYCDMLLIREAIDSEPVEFKNIVNAYDDAINDGLVEARNNLAIIYYQCLDEEERAKEILDPAVEVNEPYALTTLATIYYNNDEQDLYLQTLQRAAQADSIQACLDLATIYVDQEEYDKAIELYRRCVYSHHDWANMEGDAIKEAENNLRYLLKRKTDKNQSETAEQFVLCLNLCDKKLSKCIEYADKGITDLSYTKEIDFIIEDNLPLLKLRPIGDSHFYLKLDGYPQNYFLSLKIANSRIGEVYDVNMLACIDAPFTEEGVWQCFLLLIAGNYLPHYWHSLYGVNTYFFSANDFDHMFFEADKSKLRFRQSYAQSSIMKIQPIDILPEVFIDGDIAYVSIYYWNDWQGLVNEIYSLRQYNQSIIANGRPTRKVIVPYNCGIRF